jgi:hypothetical protein
MSANGPAEGHASWSRQLVPGTWYHDVGVYDGAAVSAYRNGVQMGTAVLARGAIAAGTGPDINISRNPTCAGDYFTGVVYDVRICKQALSGAQVLALYQAVTPPDPGGESRVLGPPLDNSIRMPRTATARMTGAPVDRSQLGRTHETVPYLARN